MLSSANFLCKGKFTLRLYLTLCFILDTCEFRQAVEYQMLIEKVTGIIVVPDYQTKNGLKQKT